MTRRLIGLLVTLTLGLLLAPLAAEAQQPERTYWLCWLATTSFRAARPEPYNAKLAIISWFLATFGETG
jgi:hypothetical protein